MATSISSSSSSRAMASEEVAFAVLAGLTFAHYLASGAVFVRFRHKHPIRGHSLPLVFFGTTAIASITAVNAISMTGRIMPCWARLVFVFNATLFATIVYTARAWRIFIYYKQQAEVMKRSARKLALTGDQPHVAPLSSYAWFTERRMVTLSVGLGLLLAVLVDIPFFASDNHSRVFVENDEKPCVENALSTRIISITLGVAVLFVIFTLYKMRQVSDGYMIKSELARCTAWGAACVLVYLLPSSITALVGVQIFMTVLGNAFMFHTLTWKWFKTLTLAKRSEKRAAGEFSSPRKRYTFEEVMSNDNAAQKFKEHLQLEWCVENLLFHEAVEEFTELCDDHDSTPEARKRLAVLVYETFMIDDAPSWINVSAKTRSDVVSQMTDVIDNNSAPESDIFSAADREIFHLLKTDPFLRFTMYYSYEAVFSEDSTLSTSASGKWQSQTMSRSDWRKPQTAASGSACMSIPMSPKIVRTSMSMPMSPTNGRTVPPVQSV